MIELLGPTCEEIKDFNNGSIQLKNILIIALKMVNLLIFKLSSS